MRDKGTLVAPMHWAEKGVVGASLNEHEKQTLRWLRYQPDYPDPSTNLSWGKPPGLENKW